MNDMLLRGRVALVTGSSRGIGAAIARSLSRRGAAVCINYFQSQAAGEALAQELNAGGGQALAVQADVRNASQVRAMVQETVARFGGLDILVNNALHDYRFDPVANPKFEAMDWTQFQDQIDGTVAGAVHTVQAALPSLRTRGGGSIINILTNLITHPVVQYHAYTTAKAALLGLSRNLAAELGPEGIRVNMIAGGLIMTTRASEPTTPEVQELVRASTPLRRLGTPEDVGEAAVALASDLTCFVTGQLVAVDGGLTMP